MSSRDLVFRARSGDRLALDRLLARYLPILRRWATGRLPMWARDLVDTDDMIQDTLVRTLRNVENDQFVPRHDGAVAAYLRQALDNRIRDEIRKVRTRPERAELREENRDGGASPLEQAIGAEALSRYEAALGRLTAEDREAIVARIEMGMSWAEIAKATDRPSPDAARMATARALARLAAEMGHV